MKIHKKKMVNLLVMTKNKKNIDKDRYYSVSYTHLDVYKRQADDYIEKPYNPAELIARVKAHLRRYRAWSGGETEKKDVYKRQVYYRLWA